MSADLRELYQEIILEHSRQPKNAGTLEDADGEAKGNNPLCGDRVTVHVKLDGGRISDADQVRDAALAHTRRGDRRRR